MTLQVPEEFAKAAVARILGFIKRYYPAYADGLEARIIGFSTDEQLNEVTLALATLEVPAPSARATAALSPEDRTLIEEAKRTVAEFRALQSEMMPKQG